MIPTKFRIVKRTDVLYETTIPKRRYWYVIQRRINTIFLLWIPMWMDMQFDNYPGSIMTFDDLDKAKEYLKDLKEIQ